MADAHSARALALGRAPARERLRHRESWISPNLGSVELCERLAMDILGGDHRYEVSERWLVPSRNEGESAVAHRHIDQIALTKAGLGEG